MKISRKWLRAWQRDNTTVTSQPNHEPVTAKVKHRIADIICPAVVAAGIAVTLMTVSPSVHALPTGAEVAAGQGTIVQNGSNMTITQGTDKLALNWQAFNIAQGERVQFNQPSANAIALNRVVGNDASRIFGQLSANGKVFLTNQNGILFGQSAQVDVGGLAASSLHISDSDFLAGNYRFAKQGSGGSVINQGSIRTADGGYAVLLGDQAFNEGAIVANKGSIALGAGAQATLDMTGDGLIHLVVGQAAIDAQVANKSLLQADGGLVIMTARAAEQLVGVVVNNSGMIRSQSLVERSGKIVLDGGTAGVTQVMGTLNASADSGKGGTISVTGTQVDLGDGATLNAEGASGGGTIYVGGGWQGSGPLRHAFTTSVATNAVLDASAKERGNGGTVVVWSDQATAFSGTIRAQGGANGGDGGAVEVSGKAILTYKGHTDTTAAKGKTGSLLLDPGEYTISAGATAGNNKNSTELSNDLATSNIILATDGTGTGDITVNAAVNWSSANSLTLTANRNIAVNADLIASGPSNITLHANSSDNGGTITVADAAIGSAGGNIILVGGSDLAAGYAAGDTTTSGIDIRNATLTAGAGNISLRGKGFNGIQLDNASQLVTTTGKIELVGIGSGRGAAGIRIINSSKLQSGGGALTLIGSASPNSNDQGYTTGVDIESSSTIKNTGGSITISGTTVNTNPLVTLSGNYNKGVIITGEHTLIEAAGAVNITGTGGGIGSDDVAGDSGHGFGNNGVSIYDKATVTTGADITITGTGGAASNSLAWDGQQGIVIAGGIVKTTGTGNIVMTGTGGSYTAAPYNHGIQLNGGSGSVGGAPAEISTQGGNITLTGHGSGQFSSGFVLRGGSKVSAGGTGNITISGDTFAGGAVSGEIINPTTDPIFYREANDTWATRLANGTISTVDGTLTITGTNLTNSTNSPGNTAWSNGLSLLPAATVKTTGAGNIFIIGTGAGTPGSGENYGIWINGQIQALGTGNMTITGTAGPAAGDSSLIDNYGVYVGVTADYYSYGSGAARITAAGGNITITGINNYLASEAGHTSYAVKIDSHGAVSTTGSGTVTINGQGTSGFVSAAGNADNNGIGITAGGAITIVADQDISLGSALVSSGGNITLAAGKKLINHLPANSGLRPGSGYNYYVYSANPDDTIEGMTGYNKHYDQTYTPGTTPVYATSGNWFFYSVAPILKVAPSSSQTITYGTAPSAFTPVLSGFIDGDDSSSAAITGTAAFDIGGSKTAANNYFAGEHSITYASGLASALGYRFQADATAANKLTVTPASLTITAMANTKTYDGTTGAAAVPIVSGLQTGDTVTGLTEVYSSKQAGTGKLLSVADYTINDGNGGRNYTVTTVDNSAGVIDTATLTVGLTGTAKKGYDGTSAITLAADNYSLTGVVSGDEVILHWPSSGEYLDSNADSGKTVTVRGLSISGADAANYHLSSTSASGAIGTIERNPMIDTAADTATTTSHTEGTGINTSSASPPPSNTPLLQVIDGGVHPPASVVPPNNTQPPATISLAAAGGQPVNYTLTVTSDSVTLQSTGGITGTAPQTAPVTRSVALVVVEPQGSAQTIQSYTVTSGAGAISLAGTAQQPQAIPSEPTGTAVVRGTFTLIGANGAVAEFQLISANGAVSISPLNEAATVMAQEQGTTRKILAASGLLAAEEKLGIQPNSISAVYVRTE